MTEVFARHARHAVIALGQVHPLMSRILEMRRIERGVPMRGAVDTAKLDIVRGTRGAYVYGKGSFQQDLMRMPIQFGAEVNPRNIAVHGQPLTDGCLGELPAQAEHAA